MLVCVYVYVYWFINRIVNNKKIYIQSISILTTIYNHILTIFNQSIIIIITFIKVCILCVCKNNKKFSFSYFISFSGIQSYFSVFFISMIWSIRLSSSLLLSSSSIVFCLHKSRHQTYNTIYNDRCTNIKRKWWCFLTIDDDDVPEKIFKFFPFALRKLFMWIYFILFFTLQFVSNEVRFLRKKIYFWIFNLKINFIFWLRKIFVFFLSLMFID